MPIIGQISVGDGATFTPAVDNTGVISWTNNKNLPNPASVDIPQAVMDRYQIAPINSPAFTGTPTAPTQAKTDNSTKLATTAYVKAVVADYLALTGGSITGDVDITGDLSVSGTITGDLTGDVTGTAEFTGDTGTTGADNRKFYLIHDNDTSYPNYDNIDFGWDFNNGDGACIALRSASNSSFGGEFSINAKSGSTQATLNGKPNGDFKWKGWNIPAGYLGDAPSGTAKTFTLPANGTYLIMTAHNSTPGVNSIFLVSLGNGAFKMAGGANITITTSGTTITVTASNGSARVYYIILNTVS